MSAELRPARPEEAAALTALALAAKAHWGYPDEWLELWRPGLSFTAESIARDWVLVAVEEGTPCAVAALEGRPPQMELGHLWVHPEHMGAGLGRRLFEAATGEARARGASRLEIVSDPHAEGFYTALGARRFGHLASEPGERTLPLLLYDL